MHTPVLARLRQGRGVDAPLPLLAIDIPLLLLLLAALRLDAAHAQGITREQHPTGRLSAMLAELLDGQDHHKHLTEVTPTACDGVRLGR